MKHITYIALLSVGLLSASCNSEKRSHNGLTTEEERSHIVIDMEKSYPSLKLEISELADLEYISPSTKQDFLVKSRALADRKNVV